MLSSPHCFSRRSGFSLIEVTLVMAIVTVAVLMLSSTMLSSARLGPQQREDSLAAESCRELLETIRALPFGERYARYNADPSDDPDGEGTAPGCNFDVPGLDACEGDLDGLAGHIWFGHNAQDETGGVLRENEGSPSLGYPRDLNGDGAIDEADHALDYAILPLEVRVEWEGANGKRSLSMWSMFGDV